jgi:predicted DNA-binding transcriptional regulator AlpA
MTALLTSREAARLLSVSVRSLERLRVAGIGPRHTRLANRSIRYRQQDLDAYVAARVVASTSEKHQ